MNQYLREWYQKAWQLSLPHLAWKEPVAIGALSLLVVFFAKGTKDTIGQLVSYWYAAMLFGLLWTFRPRAPEAPKQPLEERTNV